jgi:hypothetical protein
MKKIRYLGIFLMVVIMAPNFLWAYGGGGGGGAGGAGGGGSGGDGGAGGAGNVIGVSYSPRRDGKDIIGSSVWSGHVEEPFAEDKSVQDAIEELRRGFLSGQYASDHYKKSLHWAHKRGMITDQEFKKHLLLLKKQAAKAKKKATSPKKKKYRPLEKIKFLGDSYQRKMDLVIDAYKAARKKYKTHVLAYDKVYRRIYKGNRAAKLDFIACHVYFRGVIEKNLRDRGIKFE